MQETRKTNNEYKQKYLNLLREYTNAYLYYKLEDRRSFPIHYKRPNKVFYIDNHKISIYYKNKGYSKELVRIISWLFKYKQNNTVDISDIRVYLSQLTNYKKAIVLIDDIIVFNNTLYMKQLSKHNGLNINSRNNYTIKPNLYTKLFMKYVMLYYPNIDSYSWDVRYYNNPKNIINDFYIIQSKTIFDLIPYDFKDLKSLMYLIGSKLLGVYQRKMRFSYNIKPLFVDNNNNIIYCACYNEPIYYLTGSFNYKKPLIVCPDITIYETIINERLILEI